jgi:hypothetical protein
MDGGSRRCGPYIAELAGHRDVWALDEHVKTFAGSTRVDQFVRLAAAEPVVSRGTYLTVNV